MRGPGEPSQDIGLGKKVEVETTEESDQWVKTGRGGVWRNRKTGKLATSLPTPPPKAQTPAEILQEAIAQGYIFNGDPCPTLDVEP